MNGLTGSRDRPIRVGLVGVGNWARHGHLRVLSLLPQYALSAVQSRRREAAQGAADAFSIPHVVDTVDQLIAHPEVDLVVVLTTAPQHGAVVRAAIAAGKDVYCEWPLTTQTEESAELARLADQAGVRTVVGLQRRLAPHNRYLQTLLREGFVGRLRSARIHVSMNYFQARLPNALRWTVPPENFSSMVAIYAGHFLDMLFTAIGWPVEIGALAVNQFPLVTIIETGEVLPVVNADEFVLTGITTEGAVVIAHLEGGKRNGSGVQIDLTGDAGDLRITNTSAFGEVGDDYQVSGSRADGSTLEPMPVPIAYDRLPPSDLPSAVLELGQLYAAFAKDVVTGSHTAPSFADAVRMHRLLDAAKTAAESGRRLTFVPDRSLASHARTAGPVYEDAP